MSGAWKESRSDVDFIRVLIALLAARLLFCCKNAPLLTGRQVHAREGCRASVQNIRNQADCKVL